MGTGPAGASLVEEDRSEAFRVEETPVIGRGAGARSAMEKGDGNPVLGTDFLPVDLVRRADGEPTGGVGFDGRVEILVEHSGLFRPEAGRLSLTIYRILGVRGQ